jgi:hypothetical protein
MYLFQYKKLKSTSKIGSGNFSTGITKSVVPDDNHDNQNFQEKSKE